MRYNEWKTPIDSQHGTMERDYRNVLFLSFFRLFICLFLLVWQTMVLRSDSSTLNSRPEDGRVRVRVCDGMAVTVTVRLVDQRWLGSDTWEIRFGPESWCAVASPQAWHGMAWQYPVHDSSM